MQFLREEGEMTYTLRHFRIIDHSDAIPEKRNVSIGRSEDDLNTVNPNFIKVKLISPDLLDIEERRLKFIA
jgi:hypothetical protein